MVSFKPMLASPADLDNLRFPLMASAKLDGVRAIVKDGVVLSRSLKTIPNLHVQTLFGKCEHLDGELIVGKPTSKTCYTDTVSGVMRISGTPDVRFYVFDHVQFPQRTYFERRPRLDDDLHLVEVKQNIVHNLDELLAMEEIHLKLGYEGLILRDPEGKYKFGRSTAKEGILLKLKRFEDGEAVVIGLEEEQFNGNEATTNELGRTKRSSHKAGKSGKGTLGALLVRDLTSQVEFSIGTGLSAEQRAHWWNRGDCAHGTIIKYKFFPVGVKDKPRHPVYLGLRDAIDL